MLTCVDRSLELQPSSFRSRIAIHHIRLQIQFCFHWDIPPIWDRYLFQEVDQVFEAPIQSTELLLNGSQVTSDYQFDQLNFHIVMSESEGRKISIGILHLLLLLIFVHVSYILYLYLNQIIDIYQTVVSLLSSLRIAKLREHWTI